jgi:hypothetical protein
MNSYHPALVGVHRELFPPPGRLIDGRMRHPLTSAIAMTAPQALIRPTVAQNAADLCPLRHLVRPFQLSSFQFEQPGHLVRQLSEIQSGRER